MSVFLVAVAIAVVAVTTGAVKGIFTVSMDDSTAQKDLKAARFRGEQAAAVSATVSPATPGQ